MGGRRSDADHGLMTEPATSAPDQPPVDWLRYLSGVAVVGGGILSGLGLVIGLMTQIVFFGDYGQLVEAERHRPLIVPCLVGLVAALAGAVAWWSAFRRGSVPRRVVAPFAVVTVVALLVAARSTGPGEAELERRWTAELARLELPRSFTPRTLQAGPPSDDYEVARQWTTDLDPEAACAVLEPVLSDWFGTDVERQETSGCYLAGVRGEDLVSAAVNGPESHAPGTVVVRLAFAL